MYSCGRCEAQSLERSHKVDEMIFDIKADADDPRNNSITLNGEDITKYVRAFQVYGAMGEPVVVGLEVIKSKVHMDGVAILTGSSASIDRGAVAKVVQSLDPSKIEAAALENSSFGESPTQLIMNAIVEALDE